MRFLCRAAQKVLIHCCFLTDQRWRRLQLLCLSNHFCRLLPMKTTNCTARERLPGWQGVGRHNNHTNGLQTSKLISVCVTSFTAHVQHDNLLGRRWRPRINVSRFLFLLSLLFSLSPQDENCFIIFLDTENFSMTNYPHFTLIRYI